MRRHKALICRAFRRRFPSTKAPLSTAEKPARCGRDRCRRAARDRARAGGDRRAPRPTARSRRRPVGLVVDDQHLALGDGQPVDLAADGEGAARRPHRADQRHLGARAFGEQRGMIRRLGDGERLGGPAARSPPSVKPCAGWARKRRAASARSPAASAGRWRSSSCSSRPRCQRRSIVRRQRAEGARAGERLVRQRLRGRKRRRRIGLGRRGLAHPRLKPGRRLRAAARPVRAFRCCRRW